MNGEHPLSGGVGNAESRRSADSGRLIPRGDAPVLCPLVNGIYTRTNLVRESLARWPVVDQRIDGVEVLHAVIMEVSSINARWKKRRLAFFPSRR